MTPKLLMNSGVGGESELNDAEIEVKVTSETDIIYFVARQPNLTPFTV